MKVVKFTACPDGYRCSEPGEHSGEYVRKEDAKMIVEHIIELFKLPPAPSISFDDFKIRKEAK